MDFACLFSYHTKLDSKVCGLLGSFFFFFFLGILIVLFLGKPTKLDWVNYEQKHCYWLLGNSGYEWILMKSRLKYLWQPRFINLKTSVKRVTRKPFHLKWRINLTYIFSNLIPEKVILVFWLHFSSNSKSNSNQVSEN